MPVALTNRIRKTRVATRTLRASAQAILDATGHGDAVLSIALVGDGAIRTLNRRFRGKDRATDVLSFPLGAHADGRDHLGDLVISIDAARRQAAEYDAPLSRELERLLIHGVLHLLGHDHEKRTERLRMEKEERRLAKAIGMPWPY